MAIGNMHRKIGKITRVVREISLWTDGWTDRDTLITILCHHSRM